MFQLQNIRQIFYQISTYGLRHFYFIDIPVRCKGIENSSLHKDVKVD